MPLANGFLTPEQLPIERFFDLAVGICPQCHMVQLIELMSQEEMFNEHYHFYSSTSALMARHFGALAKMVKDRYLGTDPMVVEIGCNDGIMLRHFAGWGIRHLGIEPSANVAEAGKTIGLNVITRFFDENVAREILSQWGKVDAFLGANVMCHIPYLHSVLEGVRLLLKPEGVFIFEDPYLGDIINKTSYDQIYDEHVYYFSLTSLNRLFAQHGLEAVEVERQQVHGGSMRYVVARRGCRKVESSVHSLLEQEKRQGLERLETYQELSERIQLSRNNLKALLDRMRTEGRRVIGYGATSKSTTVTNYCGLNPDLIEFISDTTPIKHGKLSPGAHIPVRPYEAFKARYPDYALLFAWNHAQEIMSKEREFTAQGGKWIVYVPEVRVLP
jgi:methylation protein EvaC